MNIVDSIDTAIVTILIILLIDNFRSQGVNMNL